MQKVKYDYQLFYAFGGSPGSEPYVDTVKALNGETQYRIFICADCVDWKEFSKLSLAAKQAHIFKRHPMYEGQYIERDYEPISGKPSYLLEDLGDSFAVWINIQCPNVLEYEATKGIAGIKIDEIETAKKLHGSLIWKTQVPGVEFTKYKTNQNDDVDVNYLLEKFGIYTGNRTVTKF